MRMVMSGSTIRTIGVVGAGAEREYRLEIRKAGEQTLRRLPDAGISDLGRISDALGPNPDVMLGRKRAEAVVPALRIPPDHREQDAGHQDSAAAARTISGRRARLRASHCRAMMSGPSRTMWASSAASAAAIGTASGRVTSFSVAAPARAGTLEE